MKLLMISGSRSPKGQTASAAEALAEGARSAGCETESLYLPALNVERCRQCDDQGWGPCQKEGRCAIEDDLAEIMEKIRRADALVFSTPVYFGSLSESLRAFLDRFRRICFFAKDDRIKGKPAVGICVAGGGGGGAPGCTAELEAVLQTCGLDVVDVVPARRQNLDMKQDVLHSVGAWLAALPSSA